MTNEQEPEIDPAYQPAPDSYTEAELKAHQKRVGKLYDADPNCWHQLDPNKWSGVACLKCNGWFCY